MTGHPALLPHHLKDARLYADRNDMVRQLAREQDGRIAEIGVGLGDFSEFLIQTLSPRTFIAIDTFEMHLSPSHWGRSSSDIFGTATHEEFYRARLPFSCIEILSGMSYLMLSKIPDCSLDMAYIDAAHDCENCCRDAHVAATKMKPHGILIFNDYILYDPFLHAEYGVVQAVNQMVACSDWRVIGFALQRHMFCDIALQRGVGQAG